jgi:hypothetical protein
MPDLPPTGEMIVPPPSEPVEMTDQDLVRAAELTGTFTFWNSESENCYDA